VKVERENKDVNVEGEEGRERENLVVSNG